MKRLLIFDFDGVINNTTWDSWFWHKKIARHLGLTVPTFAVLRRNWSGVWETEILPGVARDLKWPPGAVEAFRREFRTQKSYKYLLDPDFKAVAQYLKKQAYQFAIVSSRDRQTILEILAEFKIPQSWFILIQGHDSYRFKKPAPQTFNRLFALAKQHGINRSRIAFIGDTVASDLLAAINCQPPLPFIAYVSGASLKKEFLRAFKKNGLTPALIINSLTDLPQALSLIF